VTDLLISNQYDEHMITLQYIANNASHTLSEDLCACFVCSLPGSVGTNKEALDGESKACVFIGVNTNAIWAKGLETFEEHHG